MYPLIQPAMEDVADQVVKNQSTDNITSSSEDSYTSKLITDAINDALKKAEEK